MIERRTWEGVCATAVNGGLGKDERKPSELIPFSLVWASLLPHSFMVRIFPPFLVLKDPFYDDLSLVFSSIAFGRHNLTFSAHFRPSVVVESSAEAKGAGPNTQEVCREH